jgi:hypothetical protein
MRLLTGGLLVRVQPGELSNDLQTAADDDAPVLARLRSLPPLGGVFDARCRLNSRKPSRAGEYELVPVIVRPVGCSVALADPGVRDHRRGASANVGLSIWNQNARMPVAGPLEDGTPLACARGVDETAARLVHSARSDR